MKGIEEDQARYVQERPTVDDEKDRSESGDVAIWMPPVLDFGTGNGDAFLTAVSTERSNAALPLLCKIRTLTTSPLGINLTKILHFIPF